MNGKKVIVGLSGGVDSSVAALILKNAGYDVIGMTMKTWKDGDGEVYDQIIRDASKVALHLGIRHEIVDVHDEFLKHVVDRFAMCYYSGTTPNPCILCNNLVKWSALTGLADSEGAEYVATGHYASVIKSSEGRWTLKRASDQGKDQTYALYRLSQEQLKRTLMPLGTMSKDEIRRIAFEEGLVTAAKADSQEICFIPDNDHGAFLEGYTGKKSEPGYFVDTDGKVLGEHKGIIRYTVGQRKGLGIALGEPRFVTKIDPKNNTVTLGESSDVFSKTVTASDIRYMGTAGFDDGERFFGKIRYNGPGAWCRLYHEGESVRAEFEEARCAVTPGQSLVLYDNDEVALGGVIL